MVTPMEVRKKNRRKNSFRFSSKRQLSRVRIHRFVPRMTGVDLLNTTRNLTCEMITENVFEHQTSTYEAQPHVVSKCNEDDEKEEDYDRGIDEEQVTQYEKKK